MKFHNLNFEFLKKIKIVFFFYVFVTVLASLHRVLIGKINNYLIFKLAFFNFISGKDLYVLYPGTHLDYYKYSPTFALLMAPIAILPNAVGVIVWNLLNVVPLFFAVKKLRLEEPQKALICWIILIELITSIQNAQSNGLIAALIIFAFVSFENRKNFLAALFIALATYIKIFGIVALVLFAFYPEKLKFVLYMVFWLIVLAIIPVVFVSVSQLEFLYGSWLSLITREFGPARGFSVMGVLKYCFGLNIPNVIVQATGAILLCLPILKFRAHNEQTFRYLFLSSLLIWIIIFNHKAESPTYIIALTGVAIWYANQQATKINLGLLLLTLILTSLSPTDVFPKYIRTTFVWPYALKAVPCILIWLKIEYQLLAAKTGNHEPYLF